MSGELIDPENMDNFQTGVVQNKLFKSTCLVSDALKKKYEKRAPLKSPFDGSSAGRGEYALLHDFIRLPHSSTFHLPFDMRQKAG